ncbi:Phosphoribosyl-ATP pyrophosphatase [Stieleria neptunia]|uniref:Phosphoribosyl-ATP pyrophosphatase n=2 Tax=Stieleria neptunia TaxID=2527979 RepID=A0A518HZA5_9BACT|nr:Phosphoribosyl-ATP pyrophosphatase [Stieleria neptunia]
MLLSIGGGVDVGKRLIYDPRSDGRDFSAGNCWHSIRFTKPLFSMSDSLLPLRRLMQTLTERAQTRPEGSYTTKLMEAGTAKIGEKILEEARELIEAADEPGEGGREHFIYEAGDLIYHTLVMLAYRGVDLDEVAAELGRREGTSGLVEKANRSQTKTDE